MEIVNGTVKSTAKKGYGSTTSGGDVPRRWLVDGGVMEEKRSKISN